MAEEVFDFVREIHAHGVTVLLVEQNVHNALSVAPRAYVYETGRIVAERPAAACWRTRRCSAPISAGEPNAPGASGTLPPIFN
jgi:ABC-type branched-subunit amino acid transport system ATPase component